MSNISEQDRDEWLRAITHVQPIHNVDRKSLIPSQPAPAVTRATEVITTHDLHGRTIQEAYDLVYDLLEAAYDHHVTELRFITGQSGELRKEFPKWLDTNRFKNFVRGMVLEKTGGSFRVFIQ